MDISAIKSMVSAAATEAVKRSSGVKSGVDAAAAQTNETNDAYTSKLADIASRYDVENITPRQMIAMEKELVDNGLITSTDYALTILHYNKPGFSASYPGELDRPDEPRNMLADFKEMVTYLKTNDIARNAEGAKNGQHIVDGLEALDSLFHDKRRSGKTDFSSAQSSADVQKAVLSYADAIDKTTFDAGRVAAVLEALAAHSQNKSSSNNA